jgi:hypothetical protein
MTTPILDYQFWTKRVEHLVRETTMLNYEYDEFEERLKDLELLLMRRARGFSYSEQLVGGYITECKRYVRRGKFMSEDGVERRAALARLECAASFEAKS